MTPMKTDDTNPEGWQRVAAAMEARAIEFGWTLTRLQDETGISETTRLNMRQGRAVKKPAKLAAMCHALRWEPHSVDDILAGGAPTPTEPMPYATVNQYDALAERVERLESQVRALVAQSLRALELRATPKGGRPTRSDRAGKSSDR